MIIAASFKLNDPDMLNNRASQYGDGLFETMRISQGNIPLFERHMKRLSKGLKALNLKPLNTTKIRQVINENCSNDLTVSSVVKLVVFRANQQRGYQPLTRRVEWYISVDPIITTPNREKIKLAVAQRKMSSQPWLAGMKHLSRLEQVVIASEMSKHDDVDDMLVLDYQDRIIETTFQNLVLIKGDQLFTPKLKQCGVKGVALKWLKSKQKVKKIHISINDVADFDGMLVCNSIKGFRAVSRVEGKPLKDVISFSTLLPIQDKINSQWEALFST